MADAPRPIRPGTLVRINEGKRPYGPSAADAARPGVFSAEVLAPRTPDMLDRSTAFTDITRGTLAALSQSPSQARRAEKTAELVARAMGHLDRAVQSMVSIRNAAGHCAKQAAELAAQSQQVLADAAFHRAKVLFDIGELEDQATLREATRDDRIRNALAQLRATCREIEGESFDRETRRAMDRADDLERYALDRERARIGVASEARRSRTERERERQELYERDVRAAAGAPAAPTGASTTGADEVERIINSVGTVTVRQELREFFRAAIHGDVESHPLAPLALFVVLKEIDRGVPYLDALRESARVVSAKLAIPREQWGDIHERILQMLEKLMAEIDAKKKDRERETRNRDESMFDGTEPIRPQDY